MSPRGSAAAAAATSATTTATGRGGAPYPGNDAEIRDSRRFAYFCIKKQITASPSLSPHAYARLRRAGAWLALGALPHSPRRNMGLRVPRPRRGAATAPLPPRLRVPLGVTGCTGAPSEGVLPHSRWRREPFVGQSHGSTAPREPLRCQQKPRRYGGDTTQRSPVRTARKRG